MKKQIWTLTFLTFIITTTHAQNIFKRIADKAKQTAGQIVEGKVEKKAEQEINGNSSEKQNNKNVTNSDSKTVSTQGITSYSKYDFVPGEMVLLADDFSQDEIGQFPLKWFAKGKAEVVTLNTVAGKWLKLSPGIFLSPTVPLKNNYTIEFDLILNLPSNRNYPFPGFNLSLYKGNKAAIFAYNYIPEDFLSFLLDVRTDEAICEINSKENGNSKFRANTIKLSDFDRKKGQVVHVALAIQGERLRIWLDEEKIIDAPNVVPANGTLNQLYLSMGSSNYPESQVAFYVSNFKFAGGLPDTRSKLLTLGKWATTGIQFDTNSDLIKPASAGTLKEIATVLKENPSLRVKIYGHTDGDGSADINLALSKKRATAVKEALLKQYQVSESRIETDGKGSSQPIADNITMEGKAKNRRVEFIKL